MGASCCGTKKACKPAKPKLKVKVKHELDLQLQQEAMQVLASHYLELAQKQDNKKLFKIPFTRTNTNSALDNLEQAFDMKRTDFIAFSKLSQ